MSFLETNGADPKVASAILEAPAFLSRLTDPEVALVKAKVEKKHLTPEIVEAKAMVEKALAELERGFPAGQSLTAQRAGLVRGFDGKWAERARERKSREQMNVTIAAAR